jgi:sulfhydrogenase subunit delta
MPNNDTPTLAVWKFASCDGCQLTLLDCEDELLTLARRVRIAHFLEASSEVRAG